MRVLLQSFETGLYLDMSGAWTNASDLARNFPNTRQAAEFKIHRRLANAFVVVQPAPAPPANVAGTPVETNVYAQEAAKPGGPHLEASRAKMTKQGQLAQAQSLTGNRQIGSNRHPCKTSL